MDFKIKMFLHIDYDKKPYDEFLYMYERLVNMLESKNNENSLNRML